MPALPLLERLKERDIVRWAGAYPAGSALRRRRPTCLRLRLPPPHAPATMFAVAVAGLFALPVASRGQSPDDGVRGWVDVGAGGGQVRLSGSTRKSTFALDFSGGVWLSQRLGLGVRLGGWTMEGFDLRNAEKGASISEVFAVLALRPRPDFPLTLNVESGWASYTVNDAARAPTEGDGLGWRVAGAWRFSISQRVTLSPSLVLSWGRIDPDVRSEGRFEYSGTGILLRLGYGRDSSAPRR